MTARGTRATACAALAILALALSAQVGAAAHSGHGSARQRHASITAHRHRSRVRGGAVARFNREPFPYTAPISVAAEAKRYAVMVLQSTDGSLVSRLHAANPHLKVLVYADGTVDKINDPHGFSSCTDYQNNVANHPYWFLKDRFGRLIPSVHYPGNYVMDVASPGYTQACIANLIAKAKRYGFDGLYVDDVTAWVGWTFPPGVSSPAYPTPALWQVSMTSFIAYATAQAHAHGLIVIGNIGGSRIRPGLWQRWSRILDGSEEQSWTDAGLGLADQIYDWPTKLANVAWSEAHKKYTLLHSYNNTAAGNAYGLASMMLVAGGHSTYSTTNSDYAAPELWRRIYMQAERLGAPAGPYRRLSNGVYERKFAGGIVLVNPTARRIGRFSLGGRHRGSTGRKIRVKAMAPTTGAIILRR